MQKINRKAKLAQNTDTVRFELWDKWRNIIPKNKKVESKLLVNKSARKAKKIFSRLLIPAFGNLTGMKLIAYCDAAIAGLNNGGSQALNISFLVGDYNYVPVSWQSHSIKSWYSWYCKSIHFL